MSLQLHGVLVDRAIDMEAVAIPVEHDIVTESIERSVSQNGSLTLTHRIGLQDGDRPIDTLINYHVDPNDPLECTVTYLIYSPQEDIRIRSNRPRLAIVESAVTGEHIAMFDPDNPNGAGARYVELARLAHQLWTLDTTVSDHETPEYHMTDRDAYLLLDLMKGQLAAELKPVNALSGNRLRDIVVNLYRLRKGGRTAGE